MTLAARAVLCLDYLEEEKKINCNNNNNKLKRNLFHTQITSSLRDEKCLPKEDHIWVFKALFKQSTIKDKAELDMSKANKLWWYPTQSSLKVYQRPTVNMYFTRCLLLWMPRKLWKVRLHCPHDDYVKHPLTSAVMYPHIRQVLDLDGYYSLVVTVS